MSLKSSFSLKSINIDLQSESKDEVLEELVEQFVLAYPQISNRSEILSILKYRESKMTTGIIPGIAVPHCRLNIPKGVFGVIGISKAGIDFDSLDKTPTHIFFMLLSSLDSTEYHLLVMQRLAQVLEMPSFYKDILSQKDAQSVYSLICNYEDELISGK